MSNPYKECESCGMEKIPANVNLCAACETAQVISQQTQAEIAHLREQLAEYEDACKAAAEESCDGNARHCTCVGLLRHEINSLNDELRGMGAQAELTQMLADDLDNKRAAAEIAGDALESQLREVISERDSLRSENARLRAAHGHQQQEISVMRDREIAAGCVDDYLGQAEQLDKLRQENERLREELKESKEYIKGLKSAIEFASVADKEGRDELRSDNDKLREENERLRKDAERYAYLKLHYHLHVCQGFYREWRYSGRSFDAEPNPKPGEYLTLDAAIDAAKEKK